jgi:cytochrome c oxidase assembly protein subunit 11
LNKRARLTAFILTGAAVGMLGLSFAAEPLYSTFCRLTGFDGTPKIATAPSRRVIDQTIRVRFDSNVDNGVPLSFKPTQDFVDVKLGATTLAFYEVTNTSDKPITALAAYNVAPEKAGKYFSKLECFCFKEKVFAPGVTEKLPVVFFVSPDLADNSLDKGLQAITLSYTYYRSEKGIKASARLEDASAVN